MRWLLLINLLAVVLLSGAVAIVLEGTPIGVRLSFGPSADVVAGDQTALDPSNFQQMPDGEQPASPPTENDGLVPAIDLVASDADGNAEMPNIAASTEGVAVPLPLPPFRTRVGASDAPTETAVPAATAPRNLRFATEGDFAPFNFRDDKGQPAGFEIDLVNALCTRMVMECSFQTLQWDDLQPALIDNRVDVLAASIRIPSVVPSGVRFTEPYYGSLGRFVSPADVLEGMAGDGSGSVPKHGVQIAVQRDTIHAAFLREAYPQNDLVVTTTFAEALVMVERGKVELAFGDNAAALRWLKGNSCCRAVAEPVSDLTFFGSGVGFAVRNDEEALLSAINQALAEMVADGTHVRLSEQYFGASIY